LNAGFEIPKFPLYDGTANYASGNSDPKGGDVANPVLTVPATSLHSSTRLGDSFHGGTDRTAISGSEKTNTTTESSVASWLAGNHITLLLNEQYSALRDDMSRSDDSTTLHNSHLILDTTLLHFPYYIFRYGKTIRYRHRRFFSAKSSPRNRNQPWQVGSADDAS
jgi:hypothetical protein